MDRKQTPLDVETAVLLKCARRCTLCFHLTGDLGEKMGQIAHLDKDPSNSVEDNLAFMCLSHHSLFDSRTSQHKNYTVQEVKAARGKLYEAIAQNRHAAGAAPTIVLGWDIRYPGGLADVSMLRRGNQQRTRLAIAEDFTLINRSPHQVSLGVIFLIQYGCTQLAADPINLPIAEWTELLAAFGMRNKTQLLFPLNLSGRSSVEGHIAFQVRPNGAGRGVGGVAPEKRQYSFEFEDLLTREKRTVSASAVLALDKRNHQRYSQTDLALPGPQEEPLILPSPFTTTSADRWYTSLVYGSDLTLESGLAGTAKSGQAYTQESFSGTSTVIVGAPTEAAMASVTRTEANWEVPLPKHYVTQFRQGFLVIACLRFFGGLHSPHYNARATILLYRNPVDWVDLRLKPEHHTDYFHRIPIPDFPKALPLSNCRTLYAWPILRERLGDEPRQTVGVSLDNHCWWDIDYVGLVIEASVPEATPDMSLPARRPRAFLCHGSEDKNAVRTLYSRLLNDGQNPWLDEEDILPGEDWGLAIQEAIRTSRFVLVCLSHKSVSKTGYVQREIALALDRADEQPQGRIYVIPVRLEPCDVPQRLGRWQYVDLFEEQGYQRLLTALNRGDLGEG